MLAENELPTDIYIYIYTHTAHTHITLTLYNKVSFINISYTLAQLILKMH